MVSFQTLNCKPIASLDHFTPDMLGSAELVEEVQKGDTKIVKVRASHECVNYNQFIIL